TNYLLMYMNGFQGEQMRQYLNQYGLKRPNIPEPRPFLYFNPELKSRFYILPGIIALTMAILSALLTSLTIAREWERGSMEQLISTPVRPHEIILGKVLPYIGISLIQTALAASFAYFVFGVPFVGNVGTLFLASALFGAGALGLGILLSTVMKVQLPAMQTAMIASMLPSILLSNFVFPIDSMPPFVRLITYIVPAKYFLVALRTLFLKGSGFGAYGMEMVFLFMYAFFVLTVASKRLKKRVA
ncbi:MAG: ABC transporter permease, partial [Spirochaetia bacterium]|nr:ABC transporter permease [Spirochaetia bacterium]